MSIALQHERENLYRVEMSGKLRKQEFERCEVELADAMKRVGPVRLLFVLKDFDGWENQAAWNDLTFYVKHGGQIERIAIVADERWRNQALLFAAAGLRRAPVEFFSHDHLAQARTWLSE
jgi:SpoIIAA-like